MSCGNIMCWIFYVCTYNRQRWRIHWWLMTHSYGWHCHMSDHCKYDAGTSCANILCEYWIESCADAYIGDSWLIHVCDPWLIHMYDSWLIHVCDPWLIHVCDSWLIHMCDRFVFSTKAALRQSDLCPWHPKRYVCHVATHCNTLQHTATHYIALQHTALCLWHPKRYVCHVATHCNALQHSATQCDTPLCVHGIQRVRVSRSTTLQHTATLCNTLQHTDLCPWHPKRYVCHVATHCTTLQHTATHCNTLQHTLRVSWRMHLCFVSPASISTCETHVLVS